jgi:hypothetical protein
MSKIRVAIHLFLAALMGLMGCAGTGKSSAPAPGDSGTGAGQETSSSQPAASGPITHGEFTVIDRGWILKLVLSPGQGFILRRSKNGCTMLEQRGSWQGETDSLRLFMSNTRTRSTCESPWEMRKRDSLIVCPIRFVSGKPLPYLSMSGSGKGARWQKLERTDTLDFLALWPEEPPIRVQAPKRRKNQSYARVRDPRHAGNAANTL